MFLCFLSADSKKLINGAWRAGVQVDLKAPSEGFIVDGRLEPYFELCNRTSDFRAEFRPDSTRENSGIGPSAGRRDDFEAFD